MILYIRILCAMPRGQNRDHVYYILDLMIFSIILQATAQSPQPTVTVWTIIAAIAATISALSAFLSRGYAKRSYELAMRNYKDRQANFSLYLIDGYRWIDTERKRKFLLFHVTINNKSDSKSSFKADLEIEFVRADQSVARAIIPHDESLQKQIPQKEMSTFPKDIRVEEKGIQSKWLVFQQPMNVFGEYRIEKYIIVISDAQGNTQSIDSVLIKDLSHAQEKNNR